MTFTVSDSASDARGRLLVGAIMALCCVRLWLMPLPTSFWLDETGTHWVIAGGFGEIVSRSLLLLQSPLYCSIAAVADQLGPGSEIVLRLPSVLATAGATVMLYTFVWKFRWMRIIGG